MKKPVGVAQLDMDRLLDALERKQHSLNMSLLQVAAELSVHDATIRQWRRGFGMSGDVALRLARWLDIDIREYAKQDPPPARREAA